MTTGKNSSHLENQLFERLYKRILLASLAISATLLFLVILLAATVRNNTINLVEQSLDVQSQLMLAYAQQGLNLADYTAKQASAEWLETGSLRPHAAQLDGMPNFEGVIIQLDIIDAGGYLAASSFKSTLPKVYLGDKSHFSALKDSLEDQIYIGKPIISKVSGKDTVQFARPIFTTDQKFSGVVVVSLDPKKFLAPEIDALMNAGTFVALLGEDSVKRFGSKTDSELPSPSSAAVEPVAGAFSVKPGKQMSDDYLLRTTAISDFSLTLVLSKGAEQIKARLRNIYLSAAFACVVVILSAFLFTNNIIRLLRSKQLLLLRLEASNLKASSANVMKSKFVSGISHELRTPLNGILGFSELAKSSGSVEESRRYSEIIFESAQRLHQLVHTLLDLAKIEAGQMRLTTTVVKTVDFFESIVGIHRDDAEKKRLVLSLNILASALPTMRIDRIKLMQVIDNLVGNAVKFTDAGVIFLNVEVVAESWIVKVIDTGVGMTQETIQHAYERFSSMQVYDSAVILNQEAGLGLSLCKELLDLMEGTIDIQSEVGIGTAVTICFKESHA
jgi:signal transduction histidine kinase